MNNVVSDSTDFEQPFNDAYLAQHTFDEKRITTLRQAIIKAVKAGDIVADLGSGQGFLALFAAKAGAKKVYCVEIDEGHTKYIRWLAELNGVADKLVVLNEDAMKVQLPEPVDVMICELVSAGFYYEPQIQVMNRHLPMLKPGGSVVPEAMENAVQLMYAQDNLYGLKLPPVTRWTDLDDDQILTEAAVYHTADFYKQTDPMINATVELTATASGTANAIRILPDIWTRRARPSEPGIHQNTPSPSWGNPQIVWLKQPITLREGASYKLTISYKASDHPDMSTFAIEPIEKPPATAFTPWKSFDPIDYANRSYSKIFLEDRIMIEAVISSLKEMALPLCKRVADVGTGPNFYPAMLLASLIEPDGHIDLIEYAGTNRAFMQTLLGDGDGIYHNKNNKSGVVEQIDTRALWLKYEKLIAQVGNEPRFRNTFTKARMAARSVVGDVYRLPETAYDFVSAYFVPESITASMVEYSKAIHSLVKAVRPGGGFMIALMLGSEGYPAGVGTHFPAVNVSFADVQELFAAIPGIEAKATLAENKAERFREGYHGMAIVMGRKRQQA